MKVYSASSLNTGIAGSLNFINVTTLAAGDSAIVIDNSTLYSYKMFEDGSTENIPFVVAPLQPVGTAKRWKLVNTYSTPALNSIATVTPAANTIPYYTGTNSATTTAITSAGRAMLGAVNPDAQRVSLGVIPGTAPGQYVTVGTDGKLPVLDGSKVFGVPGTGDMMRSNNLSGLPDIVEARRNLGLAIGTDVQAYSANLDAFSNANICLSTNNLSDLSNKPTARTNLGVEIGTNVQAYDADLQAIANLDFIANTFPYWTGFHTAASASITQLGRDIVAAGTQIAARGVLGLGNAATATIGTEVQAYNGNLNAIAGVTSSANTIPYFTGSGTAAITNLSAAGRALIDDNDATAMRTTLGLGDAATATIGTGVQAQNAKLQSLAGLTGAANKFPLFTGTNTLSAASMTLAGRNLVGAADVPTQRSALAIPTDLSRMARDMGATAFKSMLGIPCPPSLEVKAFDYVSNPNGAPTGFNFTRNSIATAYDQLGQVVTYNPGELRHDHNPVTGEYKGWLIEPTGTNLALWSEQFDNAAWVKTTATVTANTALTTAPDYSTNADILVATSTAAYATQAVTTASATVYTFSVYVKPGTNTTWIALKMSDPTGHYRMQWYNIATGTLGTTAANAMTVGTPTITQCSNGWYRCSMTVTTWGGEVTTNCVVYQASGDGLMTTTSGYTLYMWGAQLEANTCPTSYIPTTSAQVTRLADTLTIPTSMFPFNGNEGTLYVESSLQNVISTNNTFLGSMSDGSTNNVISMFIYNTDVDGFTTTGGTLQMLNSFTQTPVINTFYRTALTYKLNSSNFSLNGTNTTASTTCTVPTVNILYIGAGATGTNQNGVWIRQVIYFPRRLADTDLAALTM